MEALHYLLCANVLVWIGFACYTVFLANAQRRLRRALKHMERSS